MAGAPAPQPPLLNMTARQLDPAGTVRPVYRFDVAASSWNLPFSNPRRVSAIMPAYVVQGRADQGGPGPISAAWSRKDNRRGRGVVRSRWRR